MQNLPPHQCDHVALINGLPTRMFGVYREILAGLLKEPLRRLLNRSERLLADLRLAAGSCPRVPQGQLLDHGGRQVRNGNAMTGELLFFATARRRFVAQATANIDGRRGLRFGGLVCHVDLKPAEFGACVVVRRGKPLLDIGSDGLVELKVWLILERRLDIEFLASSGMW